VDGQLGSGQRRATARMPSVKYSAQSISDLRRLHDFLAQQDPEVARRALSVIRDMLQKIAVMPERFRPVEGKMYHREAIIDFGSSGYIARFRHMPNGDITIARIKHQKEDGFEAAQ
jgi:plasmid stabilization system protein ParE